MSTANRSNPAVPTSACPSRPFLSTLLRGAALALVLGAPASGQAPGQEAGPAALLQVEALRQDLGPGTEFRPVARFRDPSGGLHVRMDQYFHGVRVFDGEAVAHLDPSGAPCGVSDFAVRLRLDPQVLKPDLEAPEALALLERDLEAGAPSARSVRPLASGLVLFKADPALAPRPGGRTLHVVRGPAPEERLAYQVRVALEGEDGPREVEAMVDAHSGRILARWEALETAGAPARSKGRGFYSGLVDLDVTRRPDGMEEMRDGTRGSRPHPRFGASLGTGNLVLNRQFKNGDPLEDPAKVPPYTHPDAPWGDGTLFRDDGSTDLSATPPAVSVAVDIAHGLALTWDFYAKVLGRDGIDGKGSSVYSQAHMQHNFANAFWSDACFCMSYGDGDGKAPGPLGRVAPLVTLDITGHELTHGVTSQTSALVYTGESGGLNEATSDIMGKMVQTYALDPGDRVPDRKVSWGLGQVLVDPRHPADPTRWKPLRHMERPSRDKRSANAWQPGLGTVDVHLSSGPMNRAFRYLASGAPSDPAGEAYSPFLPGGMEGLGNDRATRVWYRVMTGGHLPTTATYAKARKAAILAAGADGLEAAAVRNAFAAINVGLPGSPLGVSRPGDPDDGGLVHAGDSLVLRAAAPGARWRVDAPSGEVSLHPGAKGTCRLKVSSTAKTAIRQVTCQDPRTGDSERFGLLVAQPDVSGDGSANLWDVVVMALAYGGGPGPCDLNQDGNVNDLDVILLLNSL